MPQIKHIAGFLVSAAGGLILPATPAGLDSFQIDPIPLGYRGFILDVWAQGEKASGVVQIHSPKMHDDNTGWRERIVGGQMYPLWPSGLAQQVVTQDTLKVELEEETNAGDVNAVAIQLYLEAATGGDQRLINCPQLFARSVYVTTVEAILTPTAMGTYTGAIAITPGAVGITNQMKPNTDYALLGIESDVDTLSLTVKGPDTANVRIGCPGNGLNRSVGRQYFVHQSQLYQRALIPLINSAAAPNTFVEAVFAGLAAGPPASITATLQVAMLRKPS